ncbi:MATE family efflux transporter [Peribacillus cavernae]|uniref:MATE family efflux transporter n=1 Tax=Peribacillus cavernae TaxID=1674310 RepID=A0A3S0W244_9BACI|nr:MATE family efflux transporter [Peribacillus cavernae]MDQ0218869.1 putative MATE family efflux protein [Peribacillus cavernae]RUQ31069.1 MATE family efflux transporter [Peribacillus cavernae]
MAQQDFTQGNIMKQLVAFSTPIMFSNLLQASSQFINSLWVGNLLGANALGAITVSGTVIFTVLSFVIGINNATLTILSQQKGVNNQDGLKSYLNAFVVILTLLALVLGAAGFLFSEPILVMLNTPAVMVKEATSYLQINFIGILFLFGYNFIGTILRALGDSKTPLMFVLIAVLLNAVLDPVFISIFGLGMEGTAYATILSQCIAFLVGIYLIIRRKLVPFGIPSVPKSEEVLLILKLGIPSGLQMTVISAGVMALMSVVNSYGENVVAGFGAAQRIDSIIMLPASALGTAVNSMAGQNIGAGQWARVYRIALYGVLYNLFIMLILAVLIVLLAKYGISLFIQQEDALRFGTEYLKIIAFFYPFLGLNFILNGIVRASGAMFQVLVLNIISFWVLRYPLTYVFSNMMGEKGIAFGMGTSFVISSVFAYLYYKFGKWNKQKLFEAKE